MKLLKATFHQLDVIDNDKGRVLKGLKASDPYFFGFGEAYFSEIKYGETKGWKIHQTMHLNLISVFGDIEVRTYCEHEELEEKFLLGESSYGRLYIPPKLWFSFTGLTEPISKLVNLASIEHDPTETSTVPFAYFP